ncbi:MAG TPA: hypothetical protein VMW15_06565 [Terracidiphilus sp.]|nr:hypothetical protein [Terracidiphilus sp.]HUX27803.1 hypothetical protein [Terracidiphilus sp.]
MKLKVSAFLCAVFMLAAVSQSQATNQASWLGVWQGELDGHPSVVLTLADDTGDLGGTLVLDIIKKEDGQVHIVALEPHTLLNPRGDSGILTFQCKRLNGGMLNISVKHVAADRATIHCLNCGQDAPTVEMVREK